MSKDIKIPRDLAEQFLAGGRQCDREHLRALLDEPSVPVDAEQWYADTPDGESALVTRVAALCNHPSMSFHQVALLEGAISESAATSKVAAPVVESQEPVAWSYCPECGCEDVRHEEGEHKQCASCHQEWFSSVDYSGVVRKHLSGKYIDKDAEIERLRAQVSAGAGHVLAYKLSRQRLLGRARERELELMGLRTKMADGIAFVQNLCNAAGSQPSVATGYLRDILDVLQERSDVSGNAEKSKAGPIPAEIAELALKLSKGPSPEEVRRNQAIAMGIKIEPANKESAQ